MSNTKVLTAQGILAKLLATENISVHVGNYKTAFFDPKNRILGLPSWHVKSKAMSDLFVGHEVGHALWTENAHVERLRAEAPHIPFGIYNVIEDVRIERMIQARFPGLISAFATGYDELHEDDFFKIAKKVVENKLGDLNFADRINVKAKLGHRVNIPMNAQELAIFKRCTEAQTFDDVLQLCKDVYDLILEARKKQKEAKEKAPKPSKGPSGERQPSPQEPGDDSSGESGEGIEEEEEEDAVVSKKSAVPKKETEKEADKPAEGDGGKSDKDSTPDDSDGDSDLSGDEEDDDDTTPSKGPKAGGKDSKDDSDGEDKFSPGAGDGEKGDTYQNSEYKSPEEELRSETMEAAQENLDGLQASFDGAVPIIMPTKDQLDSLVVPVAAVLKSRIENPTYNRLFLANSAVGADWIAYKKKTKKQIQPLISEFERRKAAFQYSRSRVSDSGEIDVNRLHSYKFNDEIFRSVTKLADAKNHGMIFLIDYSSSMSTDIYNVIDQTLNIVMFCQAVGIPFQVFGFSSLYGKQHEGDTARKYFSSSDFLSNQIDVSSSNVFELVSSEQKKSDQELAMRHLRAAIFYHTPTGREYAPYAERSDIPFKSRWETMMSTALQEALMIMHRVVEKFKAKHHVQRLTLLVLTDGGPDPIRIGQDSSMDENMKSPGYIYNRALVGKFFGREIKLSTGSYMNRDASVSNYAALVENLRVALGCTMIGYFINGSRKALNQSSISSIMQSASIPNGKSWSAAETILKKELKTDKKTKCTFIKGGFNYDCYFVVQSENTRIDSDEDFASDIDDDEFSGEIKTATKNKLAKEFNKFTSGKRTSRMILSKFAELVS